MKGALSGTQGLDHGKSLVYSIANELAVGCASGQKTTERNSKTLPGEGKMISLRC
jgi:hypothetical protein